MVQIKRSEYVCWLCLDDVESAEDALEEMRENPDEEYTGVYNDAATFAKHLRIIHGC